MEALCRFLCCCCCCEEEKPSSRFSSLSSCDGGNSEIWSTQVIQPRHSNRLWQHNLDYAPSNASSQTTNQSLLDRDCESASAQNQNYSASNQGILQPTPYGFERLNENNLNRTSSRRLRHSNIPATHNLAPVPVSSKRNLSTERKSKDIEVDRSIQINQEEYNQKRQPIYAQPQTYNHTTINQDIINKNLVPCTSKVIDNVKTKKKKYSTTPTWKTSDILRKEYNLTPGTANKLVDLFDEGNTIPFIARHRRDIIGEITTEKLRNIRGDYDRLQDLRENIDVVHKKIERMDLMSEITHTALINVKNQAALDVIYAPFEEISEREREIDRARFVKLNAAAEQVLTGQLNTLETDIITTAAMKIASSPACLDYLESMCKRTHCNLKTSREMSSDEDEEDEDTEKFERYYNKSFSTKYLKPHQIMAINRAEQRGLLTVDLEVNNFSAAFSKHINGYFPVAATSSTFKRAVLECYNEFAVDLFKRMKRAALAAYAEQAALEVFSSNLKQLLMTAPVRNQRILGMDPGTSLGCKLGLISETGEVLDVGVLYPPEYCSANRMKKEKAKLRDMLKKHDCSLIAIGNKTGCREAESWVAALITCGYFHPLKVRYTIVNESGASIYSCSDEAFQEFGDMHPHYIGAISLARRVQDPLSEIVKVNPKNLGIGMYQHDVDEERLARALAAVASECVSRVGVDVNTASKYLLQHVAGLSETLAARIVKRREARGEFQRREELRVVDGVNTLTYRQCAAFLRVHGGVDPLDATGVHPEAYEDARRLIALMKMRLDQIGTSKMRRRVSDMRSFLDQVTSALGMGSEGLHSILDGLAEAGDVDGGRGEKRLWFRDDVKKIEDIEVGMELIGIVVNVTLFGSFVDVGVGKEGLVGISPKENTHLQIHDRVKVKVKNVNVKRGKLGLDFLDFVSNDSNKILN